MFAACSDSSPTTNTSPSSAGRQSTSTSIVIGPDGSSSVVVLPATSEPSATSCAAGQGCAGGTAAQDVPDPSGPVGSYGATILTHDTTIEVREQSGADPQQPSIDHVVSVLGGVSGHAVTVAGGASIDGGAQNWSADALRSLASGGATADADHAVVHLLFVHGSFGGDDSVLGASVRGDTAAIFVDRIDDSSTPLIGSSGIETAVVTHEVGHLLGLVDLVLHTGRQDPDHPGHSTNPKSVMYWAVESSLVGQVLGGPPARDFDDADLADLAALRNGA